MSDSWPADLPSTLWNYTLLQEKVGPQLPMMGVRIAPEFLYTFWVGCAFIVYFAWDRFRNRRTDADTFSFRVMQEVEVAQLGGNGALLRARLLYVVTMLSLYVAMTFFGKLIFQTLNSFDLAGIRVETSSLQFQSPQWPLLLAFGFAGLAPLVLPLRVAEDWLFRRAYRAVGIPVRILQTTRNLIDILDDYANRAARGLAPTATPAADGTAAAETDAKGSAVGGKAGTARAGAAAGGGARTHLRLPEGAVEGHVGPRRARAQGEGDPDGRTPRRTDAPRRLGEGRTRRLAGTGGRGRGSPARGRPRETGRETAGRLSRSARTDDRSHGRESRAAQGAPGEDDRGSLGPAGRAPRCPRGLCRARSHLCRQVGSRDGRRENRRQCRARVHPAGAA